MLSSPQNSLFRCVRQPNRGTVLRRIEIIFSRLVNTANLTDFCCTFVRNRLIQLTNFKRSWITLSVDANYEALFRAFDISSKIRLILNSLGPTPWASYQ